MEMDSEECCGGYNLNRVVTPEVIDQTAQIYMNRFASLKEQEQNQKRRPCPCYLDKQPPHLTAQVRASIVNLMAEFVHSYNMKPDTLHLSVCVFDRCLSAAVVQEVGDLVGLCAGSIMVASKFVQSKHTSPNVTDVIRHMKNAVDYDEVIRMERNVSFLVEFRLAVPTLICFLRRFLAVAMVARIHSRELEGVSFYIAELSLREYQLLKYVPSILAASTVFLARFILHPTETPWHMSLLTYSGYQPSHLGTCIRDLQCIYLVQSFPMLDETVKYYRCVADRECLADIPAPFFDDLVA